ncbi:MAG TPA: site-specific DNA-methyltransferase [Bacteroidia bacterium]|nr:site-specific DNA-methyltransferase [Bacteroidia bacterium]
MRAPTFDIIAGDALNRLRDLDASSVHAVITDPPYCSGGFSETGKRQAKGQGLRSETIRSEGWFINDNMTTGGLVWLLRECMIEVERILVDGGSALVFTDWRMVPHLAPALESSGLRFQNKITWDKGSPGLGHGFRPRSEEILHFVKGSPSFFDKATGNVIRCPRVRHTARLHQTEKPVPLLETLIRVVAPVAGIVLDMFAGSGSTGIACINTGRKFIGIERSPDFVSIARQRAAESTPNLL